MEGGRGGGERKEEREGRRKRRHSSVYRMDDKSGFWFSTWPLNNLWTVMAVADVDEYLVGLFLCVSNRAQFPRPLVVFCVPLVGRWLDGDVELLPVNELWAGSQSSVRFSDVPFPPACQLSTFKMAATPSAWVFVCDKHSTPSNLLWVPSMNGEIILVLSHWNFVTSA